MKKKLKVVATYTAIASLAVGTSGAFASSGIVENDSEKNINIPDETLQELDVQLAYNGEEVFWNFEWDASEDSSIHHDYFVYRDGEWIRHDSDVTEGGAENFLEDRFAMMLDDGSVDFFEQYGGFITATSEMNYMGNMQENEEEIDELTGNDYVRKYLPDTRNDPGDWSTLKEEDQLDELKDTGYFLDFWHWKAHRSNSIGYVDDNWILDDRKSDEGSLYDTNWDDDLEQPKYMFDPNQTDQYAMDYDRVVNRDYDFNDHYYLSDSTIAEFDPDHDWQEGDVIPRRVMNEDAHEDSRGSIFADGVIDNGKWKLELQRDMDTGYDDDKSLKEQGTYDVAFSIHNNSTSRYHVTSFPYKIGFERSADIEAHKFEGERPNWDDIEKHTVDMFYPGHMSWDHAVDEERHAGASEVQSGMDLREFHTEEEFSYYGVESQFRDEIQNQWMMTIGAVSLFVILFSSGVIRAANKVNGRDF